jgi:hypothetical protein
MDEAERDRRADAAAALWRKLVRRVTQARGTAAAVWYRKEAFPIAIGTEQPMIINRRPRRPAWWGIEMLDYLTGTIACSYGVLAHIM